MSAPRYVALINTPGYLPWDDDPPVFDTPGEAWLYLAGRRREQEESVYNPGDDENYSTTVDNLDAHASANLGEGAVTGGTPGRDDDDPHDLGLVYTVQIAEDDDTEEDNDESENETVWCEAHGGLANPHFERPDCRSPHFTDAPTRARLNAAARNHNAY